MTVAPASGGFIPRWWGSCTSLLPAGGQGLVYSGRKALRMFYPNKTDPTRARDSIQESGHVVK